MRAPSEPRHPVDLISARIDDEITPEETEFLDAHLESCAACRKKDRSLRSIAHKLATLPIAPPPEHAVSRLLDRLEGAQTVISFPRTRRHVRAPWVVFGTAAAAILIFVMAIITTWKTPTSHSGDTTALWSDSREGTDATESDDSGEWGDKSLIDPSKGRMSPHSPTMARTRPIGRALDDKLRSVVITFQPESAILDNQARDSLTSLAKIVKKFPESKITILGHADVGGSDSRRNFELGRRRADTVRRYLVEAGIRDENLLVAMYRKAGAENNRVEFRINKGH